MTKEGLEAIRAIESAIERFCERIADDRLHAEHCEQTIREAQHERTRIAIRIEEREKRLRELKDQLLEMYRARESRS